MDPRTLIRARGETFVLGGAGVDIRCENVSEKDVIRKPLQAPSIEPLAGSQLLLVMFSSLTSGSFLLRIAINCIDEIYSALGDRKLACREY